MGPSPHGGDELQPDWLPTAVGDAEQAAETARAALAEMAAKLRETLELHERGMPFPELVDEIMDRGIRDARLATSQALDDYEHAVMRLRALLIRALVDEHGRTFTEVSARFGITRQVASRLYQAGLDPEG